MKILLSEPLRLSYPHLCLGIVFICDAHVSGMPESVTAFLSRISQTPAALSGWDIYFKPGGLFPLSDPSGPDNPWESVFRKTPPPSLSPMELLAWAVSVKYSLPAEGLSLPSECPMLEGRLSQAGDLWEDPHHVGTPSPALPEREPVWADEHHIYVRHLIGFPSPQAVIPADASHAVFLIPGFSDRNRRQVTAARNELSRRLKAAFRGTVESGWADEKSPCFTASL